MLMACAALQNGVAPDLKEQQAAQRAAEAKLQEQKEKEKQERLSQKTRNKEQRRVRKHSCACIRHLITIHQRRRGKGNVKPICPFLHLKEVDKYLLSLRNAIRCSEG